MVDSNYNMIQPVESLQTIAGLTPVKQREERKRQKEQKHQNTSDQDTKETPESVFEEQSENNIPDVQGDSNSIDFCA